MRAFTVILSLYILCLGVLPCMCAYEHEGAHPCHDGKVECYALPGQAQGHADLCSPFCANHCCSHITMIWQRPAACSMKPSATSATRPVNHYEAPQTKGAMDDIWHPPTRF